MDRERSFQVRSTNIFREWLANLKDRTAQTLIARRIARIALGNFGDTRSVGQGVYELKIAFGPGYRVYYTRRDRTVLLLLCGGDKRSQPGEIERAKQIAASASEEER